jgi:RimJ/RimL family protein N-acetyltransferase
MQLRPATIEDAAMLLRWRNDPETRANSVHTAVIQLADHIGWFGESLKNSARKILIAEEHGISLGTVRIDGAKELSWTVAPEHRGKGVGGRMVALAVSSLHGSIAAVVKATNTPSLRIVQHLGFILHHERGPLLEWRLQKE